MLHLALGFYEHFLKITRKMSSCKHPTEFWACKINGPGFDFNLLTDNLELYHEFT